ncbi:hypothetical protein PVA45_07445 (plasmid) [Entomospira entomophila]|uniref:Uncharacterized protein n=1 Tax=Entomospira entomophila TaxID=2719988 RepID=A0A968GD73_9SPIO|nr:hypothetical protein [Entomospira entomophilus]NIZ41306.1 hypothetical protein [Entomospira entomophilus]WDI36171.1 hypothetical protein PVA45_07445 [Entomospira entomophilus]
MVQLRFSSYVIPKEYDGHVAEYVIAISSLLFMQATAIFFYLAGTFPENLQLLPILLIEMPIASFLLIRVLGARYLYKIYVNMYQCLIYRKLAKTRIDISSIRLYRLSKSYFLGFFLFHLVIALPIYISSIFDDTTLSTLFFFSFIIVPIGALLSGKLFYYASSKIAT